MDQRRTRRPGREVRPACVGIDVVEVEYRGTGVTFFQAMVSRAAHLGGLGRCRDQQHGWMAGPGGTVAVNAPLTRPRGRCCLDDDCPCRHDPGTRSRQLERELARMGVPTLATALIKVLARRGGRIASALRGLGYEPIEVYPFATLRLLGLPTADERAEVGLDRIYRAPGATVFRRERPEGVRTSNRAVVFFPSPPISGARDGRGRSASPTGDSWSSPPKQVTPMHREPTPPRLARTSSIC